MKNTLNSLIYYPKLLSFELLGHPGTTIDTLLYVLLFDGSHMFTAQRLVKQKFALNSIYE